MPLKVAKIVTALVILLMFLEIVGAAATSHSPGFDDVFTLHPKKPQPSVIASFLFEKAEEETEKSEEENKGMVRAVLADFSHIAISLAWHHTPLAQFTPLAFQYNVRPPVHALHCVFLI